MVLSVVVGLGSCFVSVVGARISRSVVWVVMLVRCVVVMVCCVGLVILVVVGCVVVVSYSVTHFAVVVVRCLFLRRRTEGPAVAMVDGLGTERK